MKLLKLMDIVRVIDGVIIKGHNDYYVEDVSIKQSRLRSRCILFHIFKQQEIDWDSLAVYEQCAIVLEDTSNIRPNNNMTIIKVPKIKDAYAKFVDFYRNLFDLPVIGVTGTCGKTTTKEMIRHILINHYTYVQSTSRSNNSVLQNLKYLLGIDDKTEAAVFEMGVRNPGNLKDSCRHFKPGIRIITNIGVDHLEGCKTLENYINEKAEILENYTFNGTLIINSDDENTKKINLQPFKGKLVSFGFCDHADFRVVKTITTENNIEFELNHKGTIYQITIPGYGLHNVYNALAAIAAVNELGIDIHEAGNCLKSFRYTARHLELLKGCKGCTIIDDTWNSNPTSTQIALEILREASKGKKSIAVLGTMTLLGEKSAYYHKLIGQEIVEKGIDILVVTGKEALVIGETAIQIGMRPDHVYFCGEDAEEILGVILTLVDSDTIILLKDNHSILQEVLKHLVEK